MKTEWGDEVIVMTIYAGLVGAVIGIVVGFVVGSTVKKKN